MLNAFAGRFPFFQFGLYFVGFAFDEPAAGDHLVDDGGFFQRIEQVELFAHFQNRRAARLHAQALVGVMVDAAVEQEQAEVVLPVFDPLFFQGADLLTGAFEQPFIQVPGLEFLRQQPLLQALLLRKALEGEKFFRRQVSFRKQVVHPAVAEFPAGQHLAEQLLFGQFLIVEIRIILFQPAQKTGQVFIGIAPGRPEPGFEIPDLRLAEGLEEADELGSEKVIMLHKTDYKPPDIQSFLNSVHVHSLEQW